MWYTCNGDNMNKKGFTLAELLAVIVVLAIIISIGMMSALGIMNKSTSKIDSVAEKTLEDVAKTCYIDNEGTQRQNKCKNSNDLIEMGYFEDDKNSCKDVEIEITIEKIDAKCVDTSTNKCRTDYVSKIVKGNCKK